MSDLGLSEYICASHFNYVDDCWKEFTTLTPEEERNWQKIVIAWQKRELKKNEGNKIVCIENGEIYENLEDFAKRLGRGVAAAKRYIDNNQSYFGLHFKYLD